MKNFVIAGLLLLSLSAFAEDKPHALVAPHAGWSFTEAGLIPIQSGGRVKPLDSFAREIILFETGSRSFENWNPVELLFSWVTAPEYWENREIIQVTRTDVKRQLGLDEKRSKFSPREIYRDSFLAQYADGLSHDAGQQSVPISKTSKADPRDQELRRLLERVGMYHGVISGEGWPVIPVVAVGGQWLSLASKDPGKSTILKNYATMLTAYFAGNKEAFDASSTMTRTVVESEIAGFSEGDRRVIKAEALYNRYHPFLWAWIFYLLAALLWTCVRMTTDGVSLVYRKIAVPVTAVAATCHILGIAFRCFIAGRPPVTNMYESIIWVSLGVFVFASILYAIHRQAVLYAVSCFLATLGLIAADAAPAMMDPGIHPLVPVLRSNYWLTIHVLTITLGYAAFALTLGIANVTLFQFFKSKIDSVKIAGLNQLTYRAMQFGVVLLAAGTILGGIWADYSWGRFWGWDPKEVWALIALLGYLAVLHARFTGWMKQFGFAAWTAISFMLVVMAWYGVNFVLGVGLHSYGFSAGGQGFMITFVSLQLSYVIAASLSHFGVFKRKTAV